MNSEEAVCPLERPVPPARKGMLYVAIGSAVALCMFFFFVAWVALFG